MTDDGAAKGEPEDLNSVDALIDSLLSGTDAAGSLWVRPGPDGAGSVAECRDQGTSYQTVVLAGTLHQVGDPLAELQSAATALVDGGRLVVSVPNLTHGARRLAVAKGHRPAAPADGGVVPPALGLTHDELVALLSAAGLRVVRVLATVADPASSPEAAEVPQMLVEWVRRQPRAFESDYVVWAERGDAQAVVPMTQTAVALPLVDDGAGSVGDMDSAWAEIVRLQRAVLTLKDHQIGERAEFSHALFERDLYRTENAELRHSVDQIRRSFSWRIGQLMVAPASRVMRSVRGRRA